MKEIKFLYSGKEYTLAYTRESVEKAEEKGFNIQEMQNRPISTMRKIFVYSFLAHHGAVSEKTINEIYGLLENKEQIVQKLVEMYAETVESLMADNKQKNAVKWEANF